MLKKWEEEEQVAGCRLQGLHVTGYRGCRLQVTGVAGYKLRGLPFDLPVT